MYSNRIINLLSWVALSEWPCCAILKRLDQNPRFQKLDSRLQGNRGPDVQSRAKNKIGDLVIGIDVKDLNQSGHGAVSFSLDERITGPGNKRNTGKP